MTLLIFCNQWCLQSSSLDGPLLADSSRRSRHRRGLCAEAESTKAIKRQITESLYVAYNDATSHRPNELKN
ncbi:hypothetical protein E3O56_18045 [Pseudomonas sp. W2Aug9]|nr:hypothetical protein [Pseudomonas sp. W2Aug9]